MQTIMTARDYDFPPERIVLGDTNMDHEPLHYVSHADQPLKDKRDITAISDYLVAQGRYQDNLMFVMGIHFGLRYSDLSQLRVGDIINSNGEFMDPMYVRERKTSKIKTKTSVGANDIQAYKLRAPRPIYINEAVRDAFRLRYRYAKPNRNDLLFPGYKDQPLTRSAARKKFVKLINEELEIPVHVSTHFLRKTFAYHFIMSTRDRTRAIEYLQSAFNHSSPLITLRYAGITDDEIRNTMMRMDLIEDRYVDVDATRVCSYCSNGQEITVLELTGDD